MRQNATAARRGMAWRLRSCYPAGMKFSRPLVPARLIRRWNRFLSEARLEANGETVRAHCPNPGAMTGLAEPGMRIWLEPNDDPKRKLRYGWRLTELAGGHWAGIDTAVPNRVVKEALATRAIPALAAYGTVRPEVAYGEKSRVDFLLSEPGLPDLYLEVKNVHLRRAGDLAEFPDCVTTRGARHLRELAAVAGGGARAAMLYLVQRTDCARLALAGDIDPDYARAARAARSAGVTMLCHATRIDQTGVALGAELPVADGLSPEGHPDGQGGAEAAPDTGNHGASNVDYPVTKENCGG